MKLLFIIENYIIDPLGIAYLSSYLKQAGHEVEIAHPDETELFTSADILCYSVTTDKASYYQKLNLAIKGRKNQLSLFGGPHCTFFPQMASEAGVDVLVRGEGFEAIVDIANTLEYDDKIAIETIPNVSTAVRENPLRPLLDKSTLLYPDRELIYKYPKNYNNPIKNIISSFGCLYSCPYCYNKKYKELYNTDRAELRSVASVIGEVEELKKYPHKLIFFQDDIFPIWDRTWLNDFTASYPGFPPFHIQVRIEMLSEEIIMALKSIGLYSVTFAIETGDEHYRRDVLKRNVSNDEIIHKSQLLHQHGIKFRSDNMLGLPGLKSDFKTIELNQQIQPTYAWASIYQPYPSTDLGDNSAFSDGRGEQVHRPLSFFHSNDTRIDSLQNIFSLAVRGNFSCSAVTEIIDGGLQGIHDYYKRLGYKDLFNVDFD